MASAVPSMDLSAARTGALQQQLRVLDSVRATGYCRQVLRSAMLEVVEHIEEQVVECVDWCVAEFVFDTGHDQPRLLFITEAEFGSGLMLDRPARIDAPKGAVQSRPRSALPSKTDRVESTGPERALSGPQRPITACSGVWAQPWALRGTMRPGTAPSKGRNKDVLPKEHAGVATTGVGRNWPLQMTAPAPEAWCIRSQSRLRSSPGR